jgi:hypothetical protein
MWWAEGKHNVVTEKKIISESKLKANQTPEPVCTLNAQH